MAPFLLKLLWRGASAILLSSFSNQVVVFSPLSLFQSAIIKIIKNILLKSRRSVFSASQEVFVSVLVLVFNLGWPLFPFFSKFPGSPHVLWECHLTSLGVSYHLLLLFPFQQASACFSPPELAPVSSFSPYLLLLSTISIIGDFIQLCELQPWISKCLLKFPLGYLKKYETSLFKY